jgi:hypothetical protein
MKTRTTYALLLAGCAAGIGLWAAIPVHGASDSSTSGSSAWNRQAAASYLDSREVWWQGWPRAQKDHGTLCISCHTVVPYAMARPGLSRELSETGMSPTEKNNVRQRREAREHVAADGALLLGRQQRAGEDRAGARNRSSAQRGGPGELRFAPGPLCARSPARRSTPRGPCSLVPARCRRMALAGLSSRSVGVEPIGVSGSCAACRSRSATRPTAMLKSQRFALAYCNAWCDYLRRQLCLAALDQSDLCFVGQRQRLPGLLSSRRAQNACQKFVEPAAKRRRMEAGLADAMEASR